MSQQKSPEAQAPTSSPHLDLREGWERLDKIDEFFWVFDPSSYCFVYLGPGFAKIWERERQELYESAGPYFEGIHPADRKRIHEAFCSNSAASYNELYRVLRADGTVRWVRDRAFPMVDGRRRIDQVAGVATDVTELIDGAGAAGEASQPPDERPTLKLDRTQRNYRQLFAESADAAALLDINGYIIEANERAAELLGFEQHEMVRMHFSSFCHADTLATAVEYWEQATAGRQVRFTLPIVKGDDTTIAAEIAGGLVDFGPEYAVQLTVRDVTPRRQMAEELEVARDQLARAQKMELVGQLAGGVAHDFNNLLSVIMSCTQFIEMQLDEDSPLRHDTQKIEQASESAASLVRRLLTFARQDVAPPELVEPGPLLKRVRPLLERTLPSDISLTLELADRLHDFHLAPVELEQIVMNLGINARDAMPDGGELRIEATNVTCDEAPEGLAGDCFVCIRVSDTGVGMDERTRARIFDPFFTTKPKDKGTGLGLSTVFNLVEQNDGAIYVKSEPGAGSTFELYFPRASGRARDDSSPTTMTTPTVGGETLLIVDDDPQVRELVERILAAAGYHVLLASDGFEALDLLDVHGPGIDLLLTDVMMPEIDGPTLAERSRPYHEDLAILYTSGTVKDEGIRRSLREGGAHFIAKPFTPDGLLRKISEVLSQAQASRRDS